MLAPRKQTAVRIQFDAAECGAACLGIILEFYGRYEQPGILRQKCEVTRSGSNAAALLRAGRQFGLNGVGRKIEVDQLEALQLPLILHWRLSHFVVLEGFHRKAVFINDPAIGQRTITWEEFNRSFSGVALEFEIDDSFETGGEKPSLWKTIANQAAGNRAVSLFAMLAGLLTVPPVLFFAIGSQVFIDSAIVRGDEVHVRPILWILATATFLQVLLVWTNAVVLRRLRSTLKRKMASNFVRCLFTRPLEFYAQRFPSELASRIRLTDKIAEVISHDVFETVPGLLVGICYAGVLVALSPQLAMATIGILACNIFALIWLGRIRTGLGQQLAGSEGKLFGTGIEIVESIQTIQANGLQSVMYMKWHHYWRETLQARLSVETSSAMLFAFNALTTYLASTAIIGLGAYLVLVGELTLGTLIAFQIIAPLLTLPIQKAVQLYGSIQVLFADITRIDDVMNDTSSVIHPPKISMGKGDCFGTEERPHEHYHASESQTPLHQDPMELDVQDLSFGFRADGTGLIENASFSVAPGSWLGIAGQSGSGKTTLARLVAGLYPKTLGSIAWSSRALEDWSTHELRTALGYIDQESQLFAATLRSNFNFAMHPKSDSELLEMCQLLGLTSLIHSLPKGMGGFIEEGGRNISGGERQRVDLARLLLSRPRAAILDEFTSALDPKSEDRALHALEIAGCTCIIVTHRPTVLERCSQVLLLESGKVSAIAPHAELAETSTLYRRLIDGEAKS